MKITLRLIESTPPADGYNGVDQIELSACAVAVAPERFGDLEWKEAFTPMQRRVLDLLHSRPQLDLYVTKGRSESWRIIQMLEWPCDYPSVIAKIRSYGIEVELG